MNIKLVQGDTRPSLEFTITKEGTAVDLTGATVKFYMKNSSTGAVKINGATCSILDTVNGVCQYNWTTNDTDTAGSYAGEVEVTFPNGSIQTGFKQLSITIRDDI